MNEDGTGAGAAEIEHIRIPMPDGVGLSARAWLPSGGPAPAILEYIPYRKRDLTRVRDEGNHPYFAARGYACLRVDMRGSGDSEGVMHDMYDPPELDDARRTIEWVADQPWCDGRVGMFGTSWGGTASLQAAVDAPGPLKAVIANCATVDRFEDDIHWMGGCPLTDGVEWGATLPAILAAPPDAAVVGAGWREIWRDRLETLTHPLEAWLRHGVRGEYWRRGSVRFQFDRLTRPTLSIGGWADRYSNSVMRLAAARPDICWGIVGPWGHHYPDRGEPGPAIGFQEVALEWWDHWLKGEGRDPAPWPRLRLWRREFDEPVDRPTVRNGGWIEMDGAGEAAPASLGLGTDLLAAKSGPVFEVPNDPRHGEAAGDTGYFGRPGGSPTDQSPDDRRGLVFESSPLDAAVDLVGHARLSIDAIRAAAGNQLVCRLCDVAPDGRSNLVTRAVVNLDLDESLDGPAPGAAGRASGRTIEFPSTAYRFGKGHRLRLALGAGYWPLVWPSGGSEGPKVSIEDARLDLPGPPSGAVPLRTPFPGAGTSRAPPSWTPVGGGDPKRAVRESREGWIFDGWSLPLSGARFPGEDLEIATETTADYKISERPGGGASCRFAHRIVIRRPDGEVEISSSLEASGDGRGIAAEGRLEAKWNGVVQADREWRYGP